MYIITNDQIFNNVRVLTTGQSAYFSASELPAIDALSGAVAVYADNGFLLQTIDPAGYLRQELTEGSWLLTNAPAPAEPQAEPMEYALLESTAAMVKLMMADRKPETDDEKIQVGALWPEWTAGSHTAGEVFTVAGEPWEVFQSYDNAVYPDIAPGNSAWFTFNRPLHGTSRETARYFVQPTGAHDIYKAGEWMIFGGKFYECTQNTAYSPADYAPAWQVMT